MHPLRSSLMASHPREQQWTSTHPHSTPQARVQQRAHQVGVTKLATSSPLVQRMTAAGVSTLKVQVSDQHLTLKAVNTEHFFCKITGKGQVNVLGGSAARQTVLISGKGSYYAARFQTADADLRLEGKSRAVVHATNALGLQLSESSCCFYVGTPKIYLEASKWGTVRQVKANIRF